MTPSLDTSDRTEERSRRAAQLASLKQGLPANKSVRARGSQLALVSEVAVEDDRLVSNEDSHADKNAVEVIWMVYT